MRVLIGCEFSGVVRDEFIARGHDAMSCDLLETERPGPHYVGDVFDVIDYPWDLAIFHFPCTHTAVSGSKHFEAKRLDGRQAFGVSQFMYGWRRAQHIPKVAFEQPVSVLSSHFRKPDQIVQPHYFGHPEFKAICLWLRRLPPLTKTNPLEVPKKGTPEWKAWNKVHRAAPAPDRWKDRSRTYQGLAQAMADQWGRVGQQLEIAA
jgi:hypothetical protein